MNTKELRIPNPFYDPTPCPPGACSTCCGRGTVAPRIRIPTPMLDMILNRSAPPAPSRPLCPHCWGSGRENAGRSFGTTQPAPVCAHCRDSHFMVLVELGREVPCTFCPVPCDACRVHLGAYCKTAPCPCSCHARRP